MAYNGFSSTIKEINEHRVQDCQHRHMHESQVLVPYRIFVMR